MKSQLFKNLRWGWGWTFFFAFAYSAWVVLAAILRGSTYWPDEQVTLAELLLFYWGGAVVCGAILGTCRPLLRYRAAAFIVGWCMATLLTLGVAMMQPDREAMWWMAPFLGLVGGGLGLVEYDEAHPKPRDGLIGPAVGLFALLAIAIAVLVTAG